MMERYKFECSDDLTDSSTDSFRGQAQSHTIEQTRQLEPQPAMQPSQRLRLMDFDFLQQMYDNAPLSNYKQKLRKLMNNYVEGDTVIGTAVRRASKPSNSTRETLENSSRASPTGGSINPINTIKSTALELSNTNPITHQPKDTRYYSLPTPPSRATSVMAKSIIVKDKTHTVPQLPLTALAPHSRPPPTYRNPNDPL
jgi:hypothetical protein